ncbi:MAG TPA: putative lipoprotein [Deltaproteobacteria bacterium]|nr:putative lipoprotein [Deltaproteobacteria bacterium]
MKDPIFRGRSGAAGMLPLLVSIVAIGISGCALFESSGSVSDSSGSISDSAGSSSDSSTSSSGGGDQAYRQDVHDFTVAVVESGGRPESLRRGLAEIALERGISDWESIDATFAAVGGGLAEAGVTISGLTAYRAALAEPGSVGFEKIGRAYHAALH